jgi:putative transposase
VDRDTKYTATFDAAFTSEDTRIVRTPLQAPRPNVVAERWVRSLRRECLDRTLIYNERHVLTTLNEYVAHYNGHRPHQGGAQLFPNTEHAPAAVLDLAAARVRRRTILSGLISEYSQAA